MMAEGGGSSQEIVKLDSKCTTSQPIIFADTKRGMFIQIHSANNVNNNSNVTINQTTIRTNLVPGYKKQERKPKKPMTTSTAPISMGQMLNIKDRLGVDWKDLGRHFKFDDAWLDQMQLQHKDNMGELNYQILCQWKREHPDQATQGNLAKIFVAMWRGDLADLLTEDIH